jgi:hypothetical protein
VAKEKWQFDVHSPQQCRTLTYGNMSFSLILAHMMRVISSPSISTTAFLATTRCAASERWHSHEYHAQVRVITCTHVHMLRRPIFWDITQHRLVVTLHSL